jgi:hypothetical protein
MLKRPAGRRCLAHDLGEAALALPAQEVHLEQPEAGVDVARGEEEVAVGLGHDVARSVTFEGDLHRLLEPARCSVSLPAAASAAIVQAPVTGLNAGPSAGRGDLGGAGRRWFLCTGFDRGVERHGGKLDPKALFKGGSAGGRGGYPLQPGLGATGRIRPGRKE